MIDIRPLVIPLVTAALLIVCGGVLFLDGNNEDSTRLLIRLTATSSFLLLCLTSTARVLRQQLGDIWKPVLQVRRRLGISFAISHSFHLAAIINLVYVAYDGDFSKLEALVPGLAVYLVIYLMAFTSNDAAVQWLGAKNWRRFHTAGSYLLLGVFANSYIGAAITLGGHYWLYVALTLAVLILRQLYRFKRS